MTSSKMIRAPWRVAEFLCAFQVSGPGEDEVRIGQDGLHDGAGDLVAFPFEDPFQGLEVVPGTDDDVGGGARRHALGAAHRYGGFVRSCVFQGMVIAVQHGVGPAVVVPFEFHELGPAGVSSGDADGDLGDLRARTRKAGQPLERNGLADQLGKLDLLFKLTGEKQPLLHVLGDRFRDKGRGMTEEVRTHAHDVVDVLVSVHVPHMTALGALEKKRDRFLRTAYLAADSPCDQGVRFFEKRSAFIYFHGTTASFSTYPDRWLRVRHVVSSRKSVSVCPLLKTAL